jgi:hypothetical protein
MSAQDEPHLVVFDVDVGVVLLSLGELGHLVDEGLRLLEVPELQGPRDRPVLLAPATQAEHPGLDLLIVELGRLVRGRHGRTPFWLPGAAEDVPLTRVGLYAFRTSGTCVRYPDLTKTL